MKKRYITFDQRFSDLPKCFRTKIKIEKLIKGYINTLGDEGGSVYNQMPLGEEEWVPRFNKWLEQEKIPLSIQPNFIAKLLFHPDFQRSYVVGDEKHYEWRLDLMDTIAHNLPINPITIGISTDGDDIVMDVWVVIDGQQRLITVCDFVALIGKVFYGISYDGEFYDCASFGDIPAEYRERILNYEFDINICLGSSEVLHKYFEKINKPTFVLNDTELLCAVFCNSFTEDAKHNFVRATSNARTNKYTDEASKYFIGHFGGTNGLKDEEKGDTRMQYLSKAMEWASYCEASILDGGVDAYNKLTKKDRIKLYLSNHKKDENASTLMSYTDTIIDFAVDIFGKGINIENWGLFSKFDDKVGWACFYEKYKNYNITEEDKAEITKSSWNLINKAGTHEGWHDMSYIFMYNTIRVLESEDKAKNYINSVNALRAFSDKVKREAFANCGGRDVTTGEECKFDEMEFHHGKSRYDGGTSTESNCIPLKKENHRSWHNNGGMINGKHFTTEDFIDLKYELSRKVLKNNKN